VLSASFGDQMRAAFQADLAQSKQLTLEMWSHRGLKKRLQEITAGMWEYWL